jgi:NADPH:quinone reductase-like Zn-dependent oxidoreductase
VDAVAVALPWPWLRPPPASGRRSAGRSQQLPAMRLLALLFAACLPLVAASAQHSADSIPPTMKRVVATGKCKPPFSCVHAVEVKTPTPGLGEVLVKMASASVNPSDIDLEEEVGGIQGTLGKDFAGTVVALGRGVKRLKLGDHVWGTTIHSYSEYVIAIEALTGIVPNGLNISAAGTVPEVGTTSLQCLEKLGAPWAPSKNLTIVITSGTGGTGFIGVQLARYVCQRPAPHAPTFSALPQQLTTCCMGAMNIRALGAGEIITSTSGASNIAFARELGADRVFDYKVQDIFDAGVLPDNSVDVVYDNYGAKGTADKAMRTIKPGGAFLLLPGGENGALSKHPKHGVKQINFGLMDFLVVRLILIFEQQAPPRSTDQKPRPTDKTAPRVTHALRSAPIWTGWRSSTPPPAITPLQPSPAGARTSVSRTTALRAHLTRSSTHSTARNLTDRHSTDKHASRGRCAQTRALLSR